MAILRELQRRKVVRAAAVYLVVAWLLIQIAATIAPVLTLPDWFQGTVLALLGLGFPVAMVLAWSFELAPDRARSETSPEPSRTARITDYSIRVVLVSPG